jgi:fumarylpyruvate hydrolase
MVNDKIRQDADTKEMILDVAHCIAFLSPSVELAAGDLIYTGTPTGVGPTGRERPHGGHDRKVG